MKFDERSFSLSFYQAQLVFGALCYYLQAEFNNLDPKSFKDLHDLEAKLDSYISSVESSWEE